MKRALLALMLGLAGCEPVDLDVVDIPDSGAFQPPVGASCANTGECMAGQLCDKAACGDALGRCVQRPPFCDGDSRPECGCDGVTYWNDCLRRAAGIEAREGRGPCLNPRPCDTTSLCPDGAICGRLVFPNECGRVAAGACFVLPTTCLGQMPDHFFACGAPMTQCLDACAAIRSGQPAARFPGPCL
ncbi:MAG: hypothetical protein Q8L48_13255 [Archangium sp.]|nr:hypothetical protein [Archangium sp.]